MSVATMVSVVAVVSWSVPTGLWCPMVSLVPIVTVLTIVSAILGDWRLWHIRCIASDVFSPVGVCPPPPPPPEICRGC